MLQTIKDNFTMKFLHQLANEDVWQKEVNSIENPQEFLWYISEKLGGVPDLVNEDDLSKAVAMVKKHEQDKVKFFKSTSHVPNVTFPSFYKSPISDMENYYGGFLYLSEKLREQFKKL